MWDGGGAEKSRTFSIEATLVETLNMKTEWVHKCLNFFQKKTKTA